MSRKKLIPADDLIPNLSRSTHDETVKFTKVSAKSPNQKNLIKTILSNDVTFVLGEAGSGKSYVTTMLGIEGVIKGTYDKIFVTRPVIEAAGEHIGFLPGDFNQKIDPYIRPIWDVIDEALSPSEAKKFKADHVEVCPIAFLRGRTLKNKYIIADEMSSATHDQIQLLLTRLGSGSKMIVNGDPKQSDLPIHMRGALIEFAGKLRNVPNIGVATLEVVDVVRHPTVANIIKALDESVIPRNITDRLNGYTDRDYDYDRDEDYIY